MLGDHLRYLRESAVRSRAEVAARAGLAERPTGSKFDGFKEVR